jgi:hypothetical protein
MISDDEIDRYGFGEFLFEPEGGGVCSYLADFMSINEFLSIIINLQDKITLYN